MKINDKPCMKFNPISITLESQDELDLIFRMLNAGTGVNLSDLYKQRGETFDHCIKTRMFWSLNNYCKINCINVNE